MLRYRSITEQVAIPYLHFSYLTNGGYFVSAEQTA